MKAEFSLPDNKINASFSMPENNISASFDIPKGGGTSDYNKLKNIPTINGIEIKGDLVTEDLSLGTVTSVNNVQPVNGNVTITIPQQVNADWEATSGAAEILHKPTIPTDTGDLTNYAGYIKGINSNDVVTALGYTPVNSTDLSNVATSGSYNDLINKPTIGDGTITISQGGIPKGSFTLNQSGNVNINLSSGGGADINVVQTVGDSQTDIMSQKAVTYNVNTEYGECFQVLGTSSINLTDEQVERINNCSVISIRLVERGVHPYQYENRYVAITGGIETNYGLYLKWYFSNTLFYRNYKYGQAAYALNQLNGTTIIPDVQTVVIDRVNGIVKFYAGSTLCTTYTADEFKSDYFIPSNKKVITLSGGDVGARFYDIQIFDTDISEFYNNGSFIVYNTNTSGAQKVYGVFHGGYQSPTTYTNSTPATYTGQTAGSWTYTFPSGVKTMSYTGETITSGNHVAGGYYIGTTNNINAYLYKTYITVTGGNIKVYGGNTVGSQISNKVLGVYDTTTNEPVADMNNIGAGSYYIYGTKIGVNCWWIEAVSGNPVVQQTNDAWKRVQCLFHLKCDTLYNGKAYDDEVQTFYTIPSTLSLDSSALREPLVRKTWYEGTFAHYDGEIKVDLYNNVNKTYVSNNYVWKAIG